MRPALWMVLSAVGSGAAAGACCRYLVSEWLNKAGAVIPMGTLTVNVAGGYLIGLATAWLLSSHGLPPLTKPLIVTGFLGGLTTFSTFSLEAFGLLSTQRYMALAGLVLAHNAGAILAVIAGLYTYRLCE